MRKFFLIQAIIITLGMVLLLLVRNNVYDFGLVVTGDETAVASLPAKMNMVYVYQEYEDASNVPTAEEQRASFQEVCDRSGYEGIVVLAESKGDNRYASGSTVYPMEIKQVLEGDTALEGKNIELLHDDYRLKMMAWFDDRVRLAKLWFRGEVNYLKKGRTYLIAISVHPMPGDQVTLYQMADFCYDLQNTENRLIDHPNYVYSDVSDNEVFYRKQEMVDAYYEAKQDMFDYYGISPEDWLP